MTRSSCRPEEIITKLREAEIVLSHGSTVGEAARKIVVTEQTYYRWRRGEPGTIGGTNREWNLPLRKY